MRGMGEPAAKPGLHPAPLIAHGYRIDPGMIFHPWPPDGFYAHALDDEREAAGG
jgi:hypothetical protein